MLAILEKYSAAIRETRTDRQIIDVLARISSDFGFRSAYLIEYADDLKSALHVLDTNADRAGWWEEYIASGMRTTTSAVSELLGRGGVQAFSADRFTSKTDPLLAFATKVDMVESILVPVSYASIIVGLVGFSGTPELSKAGTGALQLLVYAVFGQTRSFRNKGIVVGPDELTPREKEVLSLAADGLTSSAIARRLAISARTVNQHLDNIGSKLRTRNRTQTVAEAIRHNLL